jgi:hypothetical protein
MAAIYYKTVVCLRRGGEKQKEHLSTHQGTLFTVKGCPNLLKVQKRMFWLLQGERGVRSGTSRIDETFLYYIILSVAQARTGTHRQGCNRVASSFFREIGNRPPHSISNKIKPRALQDYFPPVL